MKKVLIVFMTLLILLVAAGAGVILFGANLPRIPYLQEYQAVNCSQEMYYNGHRYCRFDASKDSWTQAKEYCESLGGHLVTISDAQEQSKIEELLIGTEKTSYWIGMTIFDEGPRWIDGTPVTYTNWATNMPDNSNGGEDYGMMFTFDHDYTSWRAEKGKWNDLRDTGDEPDGVGRDFQVANIGFICEFDHAWNPLAGLF